MSDKKLMFRPRDYGWGLTPQTRKAWIATLIGTILALLWIVGPILFAVFVLKVPRQTMTAPTIFGLVWAVAWALVLVIASLWLCSRYLDKHYPYQKK